MQEFKTLFDWLSKEGRVIWDAPFLYGITIFVVFACAAKFFSWSYRREIDALKGASSLKDAQIALLKTETENISKAREKGALAGPTSLTPVTYGNEAIRVAFRELNKHPVTLYTFSTSRDPETRPEVLAAYKRLEETGLVKIERKGDGLYAVRVTPEAAEMYKFFEQIDKLPM